MGPILEKFHDLLGGFLKCFFLVVGDLKKHTSLLVGAKFGVVVGIFLVL